MIITVIGGGKMGLPLACRLSTRADAVIVCDINQDVVDKINAGVCTIEEPGLANLLTDAVTHGRLRATVSTTKAVSASDAVVVIVPALLDSHNRVDLLALESVATQIGEGLRPGVLVSFETTVPVGTTRNRLRPLLEGSGLRAGIDFDLAFSPERVKSLHVLAHLTDIPKIVGGVNERSASRAEDFYATYLGSPVTNLGTLEAAEFAKLAGMVYRDVNIAIANELAAYAESVGVDFAGVRQAANTDGEAALLMPGIGVGGHCTPIYPYFLIHDAARIGQPARIAQLARTINDQQVARTLDRLERHHGSIRGKRINVLGVAFRPGVREHICSPAFLLKVELERRGAEARFHDPLYTVDEIAALGLPPCATVTAGNPDILILNTAHSEYRDLRLAELAEDGLTAIVDGRGFFDRDTVESYGISYYGIGTALREAPTADTIIPIPQTDAIRAAAAE
jgi:nucleotide sugar dehydrogenase